MKFVHKTFAMLLSLVALLAVAVNAQAADVSGDLSNASLAPAETFTMTVFMEETTVSSLGVEVYCENAQVVSGQWLQSGLMASFDMEKNKGVFSPGGATTMSGDVFCLTLTAGNAGEGSVSITLIGKNGTEEVFRLTVTQQFRVTCPQHSFGAYETTDHLHKQTCASCGTTKTGQHRWGEAVQITEATCQQPGKTSCTCLDCGHDLLEEQPALAHAPSDWIEDLPAQVGIVGSRHTECENCHMVIQTQQIPALEPETVEPEAAQGSKSLATIAAMAGAAVIGLVVLVFLIRKIFTRA